MKCGLTRSRFHVRIDIWETNFIFQFLKWKSLYYQIGRRKKKSSPIYVLLILLSNVHINSSMGTLTRDVSYPIFKTFWIKNGVFLFKHNTVNYVLALLLCYETRMYMDWGFYLYIYFPDCVKKQYFGYSFNKKPIRGRGLPNSMYIIRFRALQKVVFIKRSPCW